MRRFLAAFILMAAASAPAIQIVDADGYTLKHGQTATNELWVLAPNVAVGGTVEDDFLAACIGGPSGLGEARLTGRFQNDVGVFGAAINFSGDAKEHARFLANEITMDGSVGLSVLALGNTVTLTSNSVIKGDVVLVGQSVVVGGRIRGNLRILANSATFNGTVDGNVRITAADIVVMPGTKIGGDLVYTSTEDLFLDPGKVQLDGQLVRQEVPAARSPTAYEVFVSQAYYYLCALIAGIPFMALFPRFTGRAVRHVRQSAWKCAFAGFVAFCLIPLAALFVFMTIIGIPLGFLLLLAYAIMLYLSKIVVALGIGGYMLRRHGPQPFSRVFTVLSLGLIAIYAITAIPMIGPVAAFLILLTGLGAMVLAIISSQSIPEPMMPVPPPVPGASDGPIDSHSNAGQEEPPKKE